MSDAITLLDRQNAEVYASTRAYAHSRAWYEARDGWIAALRDERNKPTVRIPSKDARPPMPDELPEETWGAP